MKKFRVIAAAALIIGTGSLLHPARAQPPGTKRKELGRHDLSVPDREEVQLRVDGTFIVEKGKPLVTFVH